MLAHAPASPPSQPSVSLRGGIRDLDPDSKTGCLRVCKPLFLKLAQPLNAGSGRRETSVGLAIRGCVSSLQEKCPQLCSSSRGMVSNSRCANDSGTFLEAATIQKYWFRVDGTSATRHIPPILASVRATVYCLPILTQAAAREIGSGVKTVQTLRQRHLRSDQGRFAKEFEAYPPPMPRKRRERPDRYSSCGITLSKLQTIFSRNESLKNALDSYPHKRCSGQSLTHHRRTLA